jgi:hypothetical protein
MRARVSPIPVRIAWDDPGALADLLETVRRHADR